MSRMSRTFNGKELRWWPPPPRGQAFSTFPFGFYERLLPTQAFQVFQDAVRA